jgi:hypothetical protein
LAAAPLKAPKSLAKSQMRELGNQVLVTAEHALDTREPAHHPIGDIVAFGEVDPSCGLKVRIDAAILVDTETDQVEPVAPVDLVRSRPAKQMVIIAKAKQTVVTPRPSRRSASFVPRNVSAALAPILNAMAVLPCPILALNSEISGHEYYGRKDLVVKWPFAHCGSTDVLESNECGNSQRSLTRRCHIPDPRAGRSGGPARDTLGAANPRAVRFYDLGTP